MGDPGREFVPPMALWLTGLGIEVIWNRAGTPQDNAKVERMQGVTAKWSQARKCVGIKALRQGLEEACRFQREQYPTRVYEGVPRIKAFPKLAEAGRPYCAEQFDLEKVKQFLSRGMWERKISQTGQVYLGSQRLYLGNKHRGQNAYAQYIPESHQWAFMDRHGKIIQVYPAKFTSESIKDLTAFQAQKVS